jgi:hypothetical protein
MVEGTPMSGLSGRTQERPLRIFTHERAGRVVAGVSLLGSLALGYFHHPAWLLLTAGTAANLVLSGLTDRCAVKNLLIRIGFPGERDVGRAEEIMSSRKATAANRAVRLPHMGDRRRVATN